MSRSRNILILKTTDPAHDDAEGMPALGTIEELAGIFGRYNTASDNGVRADGSLSGTMMHGPGMYLEIFSDDARAPVRQVMVTMTDQDFAFPVLTRMAREQGWTLLDPESGQRLRFG